MSAGLSPWVGFAGLLFTIMLATVSGAFFMGRLSQRITSLEKSNEGSAGLMEKVVTLEVEMRHTNAALTKLGREMEGVNRQLGNIAMGRVGHAAELGGGQ